LFDASDRSGKSLSTIWLNELVDLEVESDSDEHGNNEFFSISIFFSYIRSSLFSTFYFVICIDA